MAKDLTVQVEDKPGSAAKVFEAVGKAGINIEGACGIPTDGGGKGLIHICVEDAGGARRALEQAGLQVMGEQEALITAVEDTPGSGGKLLRRVADAGVNLKAVYMATNTRVVLAADNIEKAREQLQAGVGAPQAHT